jgi:MOSC domain-containing protein YiiM
MYVFSINAGRAEPIANDKASGMTGIYKRPLATPVAITALGIEGDVICDSENHGGVDQAIYLYGLPDYAWWSTVLGADLAPGTFGENLTITALETAQMRIGDRLHIGGLTLEVAAPRIPCLTLAHRMGEPAFLKRFREAERPGVYCRVIDEGTIQRGDAVAYESYPGGQVSVLELFRDFFAPTPDAAVIRRYLATPLADRARRYQEVQLGRLLAQPTTQP